MNLFVGLLGYVGDKLLEVDYPGYSRQLLRPSKTDKNYVVVFKGTVDGEDVPVIFAVGYFKKRTGGHFFNAAELEHPTTIESLNDLRLTFAEKDILVVMKMANE